MFDKDIVEKVGKRVVIFGVIAYLLHFAFQIASPYIISWAEFQTGSSKPLALVISFLSEQLMGLFSLQFVSISILLGVVIIALSKSIKS